MREDASMKDHSKTLGGFFKKFRLDKVRLNLGIARMDISFKEPDKDAAWELYVEMLTRIVTQPLPRKAGDEQAALESIRSLFPTTRGILRRHGRASIHFSKVAVPVLNQIVRPFTTKWHGRSLAGAFRHEEERDAFRRDLEGLQGDLLKYNRMLAEIAGVEDLTDLEDPGERT